MRSEARALRSTDEGLELNVMRRPSIGAGFRFGSIVTGRARQKTSTAAQGPQRAVEVDAGRYQRAQRQRIARNTTQHRAQIDVTVGLDRRLRQRRQRAMRGVADDAKRRERKRGLGGISGRDVAFHVDCRSAGFGAQRGLAKLASNHPFYARKAAPDNAAALERDAGDEFPVQRGTGQPAGVASRNLGRDDDVAGFQGRVEPASDAKADNASEGRGIDRREQSPQLSRVAAAADNNHA